MARAVELDASRASEVTVAQLREAAQDAGISLAAFEAALAELQRAKMQPNDQPMARPRVPLNRIGVWLGLVGPDGSAAAIKETLLRSAVALAAFWGILTFLVAIGRVADIHWLVRKAIDPVALALGAVVAARLRARPVGLLLAGLAISQGAEFLMDAALGAPAVQGFGSHMALMIAGVAGVLLGARRLRRPPDADAAFANVRESSVPLDAEAQPAPPDNHHLMLRLRPT
jgi:hypothetical protein